MNANPTAESLLMAQTALRELEQALLRSTPPGTYQEDVAGFFARHMQQLGLALATLLDQPAAARGPARQTYPDGRWIAVEGDDVYAMTAGFGSSAASVRGKVEKGLGGGLRVRITGSAGFFPSPVKAKTSAYSEKWTVVEDPRPSQVREEKIAREKAQQAEWKREQEQYEQEGRQKAAAAYRLALPRRVVAAPA